LCAKKNMQVIYPTTPAQFFHALRRQMHRNFRKPLVVMTPKSLLRHKLCVSALEEFTSGGFQLVIDDPAAGDPEAVRRVVFCTGKIYYDLMEGRRVRGQEGVALVRVEQLYPFPQPEVQAVLTRYARAGEFCWVQEEAQNMGAWNFVRPLIGALLPEAGELVYVGRDEAASPATGSYQVHQTEQQEIVERSLEARANELVLAAVNRDSRGLAVG
jgi:2-oxoglutarate dehydrogenase E1 component